MEKKEVIQTYLFCADSHYLAARLLFMSGLIPVALENAALAVEFYLKCLLKLNNKSDGITHDLKKGFKELKIKFSDSINTFIQHLEESSAGKKYPDSWNGSKNWTFEIDKLDLIIVNLRNPIIEMSNSEKDIQDLLLSAFSKEKIMINIQLAYESPNYHHILVKGNEEINNFKFYKHKDAI